MSSDTDTPAGPFTLRLAGSVNGATPEQAITRDLGLHVSEEEVEFYTRIAMRTAPHLGWDRAREVAYLVRLGRAEERAADGSRRGPGRVRAVWWRSSRAAAGRPIPRRPR